MNSCSRTRHNLCQVLEHCARLHAMSCLCWQCFRLQATVQNLATCIMAKRESMSNAHLSSYARWLPEGMPCTQSRFI